MQGTLKWVLGILLLGLVLGLARFAQSAEPPHVAAEVWPNLIKEAEGLGLPTQFLKEIEPNFVTVVFEDLRTYAAEYHPEDHRMILNMRLSFNSAGGVLKSLDSMTHHDVSLLYHELLHAYLDYLFNGPGPAGISANANRVLNFANEQLRCHYRFVRINPVRQRRDATEMRFLSKEDAWEVLNETWAVFVGWQIWTKLEQHRDVAGMGTWTDPLIEDWATRLAAANTSGELLGYYEPDDPEERAIARKRFIAPSHGLTPEGAKLLLEVVLEEPKEVVDEGGFVIKETQDTSQEKLPCD
jgi:hypothetical protein